MPAPSEESQRRLRTAALREFIQVRDALARELRAKGEAEEAKAVAAVRKPPVGLWLANQLARLAPAEVKALVEATARLRRVQSSARGGASGEALRQAMRDQREALARLGDATGRAALEAGTALTLALQRRVQNTLQAAAASEPEPLLEGALAAELQPSGFEGVFGATPEGAMAAPGETLAEREAAPEKPRSLAPAAPGKAKDGAAPGLKKADGGARRRADEERARKRELAAAKARELALARSLRTAEKEARRQEALAKKLGELAAAREREAAAAREKAGAARRSADQAAARALELRRKQG